MKFHGLARASGAPVIAGLDNGRGRFLTHAAVDLGFGVRHTVDYMLDVARQLGGAEVDPRPALSGAASVELNQNPPLSEHYAAVFPTTGPFAPGRNWPSESFAALATLLDTAGYQPVILGASDATDAARLIQRALPSAIDLTGQTSVPDLVEIVRGARVTITGDSFPGHLANAVGCPVVSIFGPSNHSAWGPYGAVEAQCANPGNTIVVRHDVPCSPCLYTGYRLGRPHGCPVRTCLLAITPEDVMSAVRLVTRAHV